MINLAMILLWPLSFNSSTEDHFNSPYATDLKPGNIRSNEYGIIIEKLNLKK